MASERFRSLSRKEPGLHLSPHILPTKWSSDHFLWAWLLQLGAEVGALQAQFFVLPDATRKIKETNVNWPDVSVCSALFKYPWSLRLTCLTWESTSSTSNQLLYVQIIHINCLSKNVTCFGHKTINKTDTQAGFYSATHVSNSHVAICDGRVPTQACWHRSGNAN